MALGYAEGKGVPYHRAIAKYTPTWPRSFTPANQEMRNLVAKMKLIPNRALMEGKRILFCDDSIVRGTQLRDTAKILYDYGAKEVHMRIACPPLIYSCPFVGFTSSKSPMELITRQIIQELEGDGDKNLEKYATTDSPEYKKMVQMIADRFGLSSLKYNTLEILIEAIGLPNAKFVHTALMEAVASNLRYKDFYLSSKDFRKGSLLFFVSKILPMNWKSYAESFCIACRGIFYCMVSA
jgi:amidophosphoribosyltransferase